MFLPGEDSANEGEAEGEDMSEEDGRMEVDEDVLQRVEEEENTEANEEQASEIQLETLKQEEEVCEQKGAKGIDEEVKSEEESTDLSFPDTTILLTHLQSNR